MPDGRNVSQSLLKGMQSRLDGWTRYNAYTYVPVCQLQHSWDVPLPSSNLLNSILMDLCQYVHWLSVLACQGER